LHGLSTEAIRIAGSAGVSERQELAAGLERQARAGDVGRLTDLGTRDTGAGIARAAAHRRIPASRQGLVEVPDTSEILLFPEGAAIANPGSSNANFQRRR